MIKIIILSPFGVVYDSNTEHIMLPGAIGRFSVFPRHAPLVSTLVKGDIVCYAQNGEKTVFTINNGFVEVKDDRATVCVELFDNQNNDYNHA